MRVQSGKDRRGVTHAVVRLTNWSKLSSTEPEDLTLTPKGRQAKRTKWNLEGDDLSTGVQTRSPSLEIPSTMRFVGALVVRPQTGSEFLGKI